MFSRQSPRFYAGLMRKSRQHSAAVKLLLLSSQNAFFSIGLIKSVLHPTEVMTKLNDKATGIDNCPKA